VSTYKPKNSPYYHFDFQLGGQRFHGSTERTSRREAEQVEKDQREAAKKAVKAAKAARGGPLTIDATAQRYWEEVGMHHVNSDTTDKDLERLVAYFKPTKLMTEITDDDIAKMVQWRRAQRRWDRETDAAGNPMPFVSNATVNRSATLVMKKLFTRAKRWRHTFPDEPHWRTHFLPEPKERVRELRKDEGAALELATRSDYEPIFAFERATGLRLNECLLRWQNVDWETGWINTIGKGNKPVRTALTPTVRAILEPLRGHDPDWVFTYVAPRTVAKSKTVQARVRGKRYPITYSGLKSQWKRIKRTAGVENFRFHDFRHDVGTKLLRMTGNLKTVQKALNHADIKTTTRYAHVLDEEVAADMERLAKMQSRNTKSRKKSQTAGGDKG
jgi:integrase